MDTLHFEQQYLPKNYAYGNIKLDFKTENDFQVEFNANINNLSAGDKWIAEFERLTKTNWKIRATYPNLKGMQRKDFVCHHSDYRSTEKRKRSNTRIKLSACNAKLTVKIKDVNKYSRCRYQWIKEGMPATVTIFSQHHHAIWNAQALSFRRIDADIHDKFMDYFNQGLSVSSAIEYHINQIDLDPDVENPIIARADAAINPRQRTVSYLYDLWRSANLGSRTGEGMWTTLEDKLPKYTSLGTTVVVDKEKKVIAIVTQLMQRAHTLANSCDIVFIDSSASCDAENHSITFKLLTKADYIEDSSRIVVRNFQGSVVYLVSSETQIGRQYEVDSSVGCCTCDRGMDGSFCKHQVAVYKFFGDSFPNLPPVTAAARHECAVLALGPSALPLAFYSEMNSTDKDDLLSIAECVEVIDSCRSTTPLLPEAKSATVTGACVSDTQQAWTTLSGRMESLLAQQSGDCSELLAEIQKMEQRLNKVTTYTINFLLFIVQRHWVFLAGTIPMQQSARNQGQRQGESNLLSPMERRGN